MEGPIVPGDVEPKLILQVISMSRQFTRVQFENASHEANGTIFIKAGQLVGASAGESQGTEAFFRLMSQEHKFFRVEREPESARVPRTLGALLSLLDSDPAPTPGPSAKQGATVIAPERTRVPSAPARAAATHPAPPTLAGTPSARPPKPAVRPSATPFSRVAVPPNEKLASTVAQIRGLEVAIVGALPDCLTYAHWSQRAEPAPTEAELAAFVAKLVDTTLTAFGPTPDLENALDITIALPGHTVVARYLAPDLVLGLAFSREIPLGFVKVQIDRAMPELRALETAR